MQPPTYTHLQVGHRQSFDLAMRRRTSNIQTFLTREKPRGPSGELEVYENKQIPSGIAVLIRPGQPAKSISL